VSHFDYHSSSLSPSSFALSIESFFFFLFNLKKFLSEWDLLSEKKWAASYPSGSDNLNSYIFRIHIHAFWDIFCHQIYEQNRSSIDWEPQSRSRFLPPLYVAIAMYRGNLHNIASALCHYSSSHLSSSSPHSNSSIAAPSPLCTTPCDSNQWRKVKAISGIKEDQ
jgi:hypothetical protein